jgi:hypothetical protein
VTDKATSDLWWKNATIYGAGVAAFPGEQKSTLDL